MLVQNRHGLPADIAILQIEPAAGDGQLERVKGEAGLEVRPLVVIKLEPRVAERAAGGVAACEELGEVDGFVLFDLRVDVDQPEVVGEAGEFVDDGGRAAFEGLRGRG